MKWAKPVTMLLIVVGIGLAIWGGYTVYKRTKAEDEKIVSVNEPDTNTENKITILPDSVVIPKKDSVTISTPGIPADTTKFVLETSDAKRAFSRFNKLKTFQWNVQMETKDSLSYKIFMLLPAMAADTTRILDSLSKLNGRRVYVEN